MTAEAVTDLRVAIEEGALRSALVAADPELRDLAQAIAQGCWIAGWLEAHA